MCKEFWLYFVLWWDVDEYEFDLEGVVIIEMDYGYFNWFEVEIGCLVNVCKCVWYVLICENEYVGDQEKMWQEYLFMVEEVFMVLLQGVILYDVLCKVCIDGWILKVLFCQGVLVNMFWDLGVSDDIVIWFYQCIGIVDYFIWFF